MQVTSIFYQQKFAMENCGGNRFEMVDVGVTVSPSDGQSAADAYAEAKAFVEARKPNAANGNGKAAPPFTPSANGKPVAAADPPFVPNETPAPPAKKRGKGRPPKAYTEAKAAVDQAASATTLEKLLEGFNEARAKASAFTLEEWEMACTTLGALYKKLNSAEANPETVVALVNAFKAERTAIDTKRNGAAAA